ncbi:MAG: helix-turn-helix domain-containing protein [Lachnospiraceae bacterium]|jgi:predicted transcriptional regulator|nr:helix-turn-helix domain-containing protein [Lachnospiraceae bacterium]
MELEINDDSLVVFKALSSSVRLRIIQLLSKKKMNLKNLSMELGLSEAIVSMHILKLEEANIVKSQKKGKSKVISLKVDTINIRFPEKIFKAYDSVSTEVPVGHYTTFNVEPTCGLASSEGFIGDLDEPKFFMDPGRMDAGVIWFGKGYVEYQTPNFIKKQSKIEMIELSMELSSEFPTSNNNWPSDITISLNDVELGTWTSPGDFSDVRGKYNPSWYPDETNQYGLLETIRIDSKGSFINANFLSGVTINDIPNDPTTWKIKFEIKPDAENIGGLTLFGKGFGNYDQNIKLKIYYSSEN